MNSKELVERYFDSVEGRSAAPITDYLAADIRWHLPPAHPFGSDFSGIDGVLGMMAKGAGWLANSAAAWEAGWLASWLAG